MNKTSYKQHASNYEFLYSQDDLKCFLKRKSTLLAYYKWLFCEF